MNGCFYLENTETLSDEMGFTVGGCSRKFLFEGGCFMYDKFLRINFEIVDCYIVLDVN